jgi:hypothetical protein
MLPAVKKTVMGSWDETKEELATQSPASLISLLLLL